ncbi:hypothetical protein BDV28DRAFT_163350 [Aspergillus coremiiformis]|uniref:Uncharacterized protein n=1 Tax=Aspergillus coremiiformis TaxID=138285 RepID=A0A5N6ZC68_9EURO|nr:hypothetical protein BDV28DRAFT_163350 [Aspergillus coremiiformis]
MAFFREGPVVSHPGHGLVQPAGVNKRAGRRPQSARCGDSNKKTSYMRYIGEAVESNKPRASSFPGGRRGNQPAHGNNNIQRQAPRQPRGQKEQKFTPRRSRRGPMGKGPQHGPNNAPRHPAQRRGPKPRYSRDGDVIMRDAPLVYKRPVRRPGTSIPHTFSQEDVVMLDVFTTSSPIEQVFAALSIAAPQFATSTGEEPEDVEMTEAPPLFC